MPSADGPIRNPQSLSVDVIAKGGVKLRWEDGPGLVLPPDDQRRVEAVWQQGVARHGHRLHDSPILSYRRHEADAGVTTVRGVYRPYRYYYAQCRSAELGTLVEPIGVSGLSILMEGDAAGVVIGRRSERVTQYPGLWECVPSGGMDDSHARPDRTVDFVAMLRSEFEEETCLPASAIARIAPFAVIYDVAARTYDVCCEVRLSTNRTAVLNAMRRSEEYDDVAIVAENDIAAHVRQLGDQLIPLSRAILDLHRESAEVSGEHP